MDDLDVRMTCPEIGKQVGDVRVLGRRYDVELLSSSGDSGCLPFERAELRLLRHGRPRQQDPNAQGQGFGSRHRDVSSSMSRFADFSLFRTAAIRTAAHNPAST